MLKTQSLSTEEQRLTNGATLLYKQAEGAPRLAISVFIPGGNQLDRIPGFSDVIDRLLMKGTRTRDQEQLSVEIDGLTLELDTDTKRDYSVMYATLLEEDLEAAMDIMSDIFFNSTLEEFDREKEKLAGEIQMDLDSPRGRASDQFIRTIFAETPYGTVGSVILDNLDKMDSLEEARTHYRHVYRPDRMVVSVAGDLSAERRNDLVQQIEDRFGEDGKVGVAIGTASGTLLKNLTLKEDRYITFERDDSSQMHIFKGWLVPDARHDDYVPLMVMNTILGGAGLSSRLFVEMRDKKGLAYNVRSSLEAFKYRGMFSMYIGTEPSNRQKCLDGFIEECEKLMNDVVPALELDEAKRNILGRRTVFLETVSQQANFIGANYVMGRSLEDIDSIPQRILAVTAEDVRRVAQTYFSQPSIVSAVGPSKFL